jgi:hypothetical protein
MSTVTMCEYLKPVMPVQKQMCVVSNRQADCDVDSYFEIQTIAGTAYLGVMEMTLVPEADEHHDNTFCFQQMIHHPTLITV